MMRPKIIALMALDELDGKILQTIEQIIRHWEHEIVFVHTQTQALPIIDSHAEVILPIEANQNYEKTIMKDYTKRIPNSQVEIIDDTIKGALSEILLRHPETQFIIMGHRQAAFKHWLLGSTANRVIEHSNIPIIVIPEGTGEPKKKQLKAKATAAPA